MEILIPEIFEKINLTKEDYNFNSFILNLESKFKIKNFYILTKDGLKIGENNLNNYFEDFFNLNKNEQIILLSLNTIDNNENKEFTKENILFKLNIQYNIKQILNNYYLVKKQKYNNNYNFFINENEKFIKLYKTIENNEYIKYFEYFKNLFKENETVNLEILNQKFEYIYNKIEEYQKTYIKYQNLYNEINFILKELFKKYEYCLNEKIIYENIENIDILKEKFYINKIILNKILYNELKNNSFEKNLNEKLIYLNSLNKILHKIFDILNIAIFFNDNLEEINDEINCRKKFEKIYNYILNQLETKILIKEEERRKNSYLLNNVDQELIYFFIENMKNKENDNINESLNDSQILNNLNINNNNNTNSSFNNSEIFENDLFKKISQSFDYFSSMLYNLNSTLNIINNFI